jgi:hypothetical protein
LGRNVFFPSIRIAPKANGIIPKVTQAGDRPPLVPDFQTVFQRLVHG